MPILGEVYPERISNSSRRTGLFSLEGSDLSSQMFLLHSHGGLVELETAQSDAALKSFHNITFSMEEFSTPKLGQKFCKIVLGELFSLG